jgi:hypothetical protein
LTWFQKRVAVRNRRISVLHDQRSKRLEGVQVDIVMTADVCKFVLEHAK